VMRTENPPLPPVLDRYFGGPHTRPLELWSPDTVRAYQRDALAEQLEHVFAHNAFYREKFDAAGVKPADFRTLEDLTRFPWTHKDELRGQPWRLLSVPRRDVRLVHT